MPAWPSFSAYLGNRLMIFSPPTGPSTTTCPTCTPSGPYSFAIAWAKFLRAPLDELNAPKLGLPRRDALAPVKSKTPFFDDSNYFSASLANKKPPKQQTRQLSSK